MSSNPDFSTTNEVTVTSNFLVHHSYDSLSDIESDNHENGDIYSSENMPVIQFSEKPLVFLNHLPANCQREMDSLSHTTNLNLRCTLNGDNLKIIICNIDDFHRIQRLFTDSNKPCRTLDLRFTSSRNVVIRELPVSTSRAYFCRSES